MRLFCESKEESIVRRGEPLQAPTLGFITIVLKVPSPSLIKKLTFATYGVGAFTLPSQHTYYARKRQTLRRSSMDS